MAMRMRAVAAPAPAPVAAPAPGGSLLSEALGVFFQQPKSFLSAHELGRFSMSSKDAMMLVHQHGVWRLVWDYVSEACKEFRQEQQASGLLLDRFESTCWNLEAGLLDCFYKPDPRVLDRVGYQQAVCCLVSQHCWYCGEMAAQANCLTMERICTDCYEKHPPHWLVSKTQAMDVFCVTEDDLLAYPEASPDGGRFRFVLLQDVQAASYAKWGGADGLEAEILQKSQKAKERFEHQAQCTHHKRPKLMKRPLRPAEDPRWINSKPLPIGCIHDINGCSPPETLQMSFSVECNTCHVRGGVVSMVRHCRLEHEQCAFLGEEPGEAYPPQDLENFYDLGFPLELISLMNNAVVRYGEEASGGRRETFMSSSFDYHFDHYPYDDHHDNDPHDVQSCTIRFGHHQEAPNIVIAVDMEKFEIPSRGGLVKFITIWFQLDEYKVPLELLRLVFEESSSKCELAEGTDRSFAILLGALELVETTPSQLLAALLGQAWALVELRDVVFDDYMQRVTEKKRASVPHLLHALKILHGHERGAW